MDFDNLVSRLKRVRGRENDVMALCPAHKDTTPSLHITRTEEGKILWKCHAGCSQDEVADALRRIGALPDKNYRPPELRRRPSNRGWKRKSAARRAPPAKTTPIDPDGLPSRLWQAAEDIRNTPGGVYLERRLVLPADRNHREIRWIGQAAAKRLPWLLKTPDGVENRRGCVPETPREAAGLLVYRFRRPGDDPDGAGACQIEAITAGGGRVWFRRNNTKRPTVWTSVLENGTRLFAARIGPGRGAWICEGPIDPLALLMLETLKDVDLHGASVLGAAGTGAVALNGLAPYGGPINLAFDNDAAGRKAAASLTRENRKAQPSRRILDCSPPERDKDWTTTLEVFLKHQPPPVNPPETGAAADR